MVFNTIVQRGVGFLIMAAIVYLLLRLVIFRPRRVKSDDGMTSADFENAIYKVYEHCTENSLKLFQAFLVKYQVRNPRAFSEKEKGELKSLFLEIVVPESDVSVATKEQFRNYLDKIGVNDMHMRPRYNKYTLGHIGGNKAKEEYFSNYGNVKIGECLKNGLDHRSFKIFDGPTICDGDKRKLIAYIVVGDTGAFVINTRELANDINDSDIDTTEITIQKGDQWSVKKNGNDIQIQSPTEDVLEAKSFIEEAMGDMLLDIHPIVAIPEFQLKVQQDEDLPYKVVGTRTLCPFIRDYPGKLSLNEKTEILSRLNKMITE